MANENQAPVIAFVWRPEEAGAPVVQMAARTGSRAVFDFSMTGMDGLFACLQKAGSAGCPSDIKISAETLMDPALESLLKRFGVQALWVECHPPLSQEELDAFLRRLSALSESCECFPIVGDVDLLTAIVKSGSGIGRVVLKGCEASGWVGGETTSALYSAASEMLRKSAQPMDLLIWGAIWTPEAAAAFLATGAAGIVFESVHWLTDLAAVDDLQRRQIANLRPDSSALVGLELQVPCRLFNKGNSLAFKEFKKLEDSLCAGEIDDKSRRCFVSQVQAKALLPLASHFTPSETIPLSVEAAFAAPFAERFGTATETAVRSFMAEISSLCLSAEAKRDCFLNSPVAGELGIKFPFIQGAMTCVSEVPEFALRVAEAGGLPTIALGLMDKDTLEKRLGRLAETMGERPYAVNVIALAENPFREMHLAWIKQHRPRFVWIAGGDLSPIKELLDSGLEVAYIAPDTALLELALKAGVRYVVCEGYEAGGHVGAHSALTLAQMVLDLKRRKPALFEGRRFILAGGIYNRRTAFMAALLGADAIQMGTAYLATQDVVETGALTALYRRLIVESAPGGTVISGQTTGLRVRSLRTARVAAILSLEREFASGRQDEQTFRTKIEGLAAGSLFAAARGMDRRSGVPLDEQAALERGQFMVGACSGMIDQIRNLKSFHRELAEGPLALRLSFAWPGKGIAESAPAPPLHKAAPKPMNGNGHKHSVPNQACFEGIAITGMSIVNALGSSPEGVWEASLAMKCGITPVPSSRWNHDLYYDPRPRIPDKTYCKVGAFLDFPISRHELDIPPQDFRTMTDATRLTMWLADRAIRASGILESDIPRERIGVIISQNSGEAAGTLTNLIIRAYVNDIVAAVKRAVPLTPEQLGAVEREVKAGRMAPDDTTLLGRLNCAAPGFICNRYGFRGPSYAVSAACATSLVAIHSAMQMIRAGIIDAAIVGGGEDSLTHLHFLEFSALGALFGLSGRESSPSETSRPFDAERDGMVLGEGGGMIVIERESVARARGAQLHAVINGMGASNNNLGMVESSSITQEIAIGASFRGMRYGPDAVDLVECHATSTRQGDVEEVHALKSFFNSSKRTVLTSFKSQIGHTLGASGINNLIRGVMAMKAGIFPATLNYAHPDPDMNLNGSGLLIAPEPIDWKRRAGQPRRLQVNAFGFGGSNYVVQVEQASDEVDMILLSPDRDSVREEEQASGASAPDGISFFRTEIGGRFCRMAVVAPSDKEALALIENSEVFSEAGIASPKASRSLAQRGIFASPEDLAAPPLALIFPGQGAHYAGMGRELYETFPVIKEWMDRIAGFADFDLLHLMFHDREENLQKTRWQQPALFVVEYAIARFLLSLGVQPAAMAGHSLGELTALCLAGVYSPEDGFRIVNMRAICMDKAATMNIDPGVMAAADAPLELLQEMIRERDGVYIGNINSPKQIVLSGNTEAVKDLGKALKAKGYRFTLLRVSMAFHSPIMRTIHDELETFVASIPFHSPRIPVISNTTMAPYPSDPGEIRRILMAHLESPVHWMNNVQTLWNDFGIRHFAEVGPGDIFSNLIADTLPEPYCIQTCIPSAEGRAYRTALAQLYVQGHLKIQGAARFVDPPAREKPLEDAPIASAPAASPLRPTANGSSKLQDSPAKSAAVHLDSALALVGKALPAGVEAPGDPDLMESLIRIIMDATGFERDEIKPEMDLRKDLSIRSSRLPVIMDAAESLLGITIELEDFIDVRTVADMAQRISGVIARQQGGSARPPAKAEEPKAEQDARPKVPEEETSVRRFVFSRVPLDLPVSNPIELSLGESVLILSPRQGDIIAEKAGDIFRRDYEADAVSMYYMPSGLKFDQGRYEIQSDEGSRRAAASIAKLACLAGMVIILPQVELGEAWDPAGMTRFLRGLLLPLKAFLGSPAKKFVVLIHSRENADTFGGLPAEGMLGLFLSAAQEYSSVQFRTLEIGGEADLDAALLGALDRGYAAVEMLHRDGRFFASEGRAAPAVFGDAPGMLVHAGDVIVISGGAAGIGAHLARSLAPFGPRLVFLGRTQLDSGSERASEIVRTLADLHASGIEATYRVADVTDSKAVRAIMADVAIRYGRIDGIVHGAGVLRDGLLSQMTPDDLSLVMDVKCLGAWNLFSAAEGSGLRFFAALSSAAAIQGNPGQANYAAGNRMMSAMLRTLRLKNKPNAFGAGSKGRIDIQFKALMLPPIEGTGMAEDPEIREMLRRKGVAYIHVNELAGLFCRELMAAPYEDDWVLFMRCLPSLKTARLDDAIHPAASGELFGDAMAFKAEDFPMIEEISGLDIRRGRLEASRTFSREKDLWIEDHRPFKAFNHPLVSAVMFVETFMEAARILYPYLQVRGVRNARFLEMLHCPEGIARPSKIECRHVGEGIRETLCEVSVAAQEISPAGRLTGSLIPRCEGQVILDGGIGVLGEGFHDFPVRLDELESRPMDRKQVLKWYQDHSGLQGRYRVIESLDGAGPTAARGLTVYKAANDFSGFGDARYQYSPYLLEALLQLAIFHFAATAPSERRSMIPVAIGEMKFARQCRTGEPVVLEARMRAQDEEGVAWDARGLDGQGRAIMQVAGMRMNWVSD